MNGTDKWTVIAKRHAPIQMLTSRQHELSLAEEVSKQCTSVGGVHRPLHQSVDWGAQKADTLDIGILR